MRLNRGRFAASLIGAIGIVLWATETALVNGTKRLPPLETVALSFFFAAGVALLLCLVNRSNPLVAFRQPLRVWIFTVGSLTGYHACIYYATQKAPPAAAALLQGTTPLMIILGSALLPGERLRWWHVCGGVLGLSGVVLLIEGPSSGSTDQNGSLYLLLIGVAAALLGGIFSRHATAS